MKYLSENLRKHMQNLHAEKYKMLIKETKADLNKWREILCSLIRRFNINCESSTTLSLELK